MKYFLGFVLNVSVFSVGYSQPLTGTVMDGGDVLPGVMVHWGEFTAISLNDGSFSFDNVPDDLLLTVAYPGYETYRDTINKDELPLHLDIQLSLPSRVLGEVVMTAGRHRQRAMDASVSISLLHRDLISDRAQSDVTDALHQAPGLQKTENQINIRSGSGWSYGTGTRVLVLLDEMPLISPDAGQVQWSQIPAEAIGRMEIVKGASSALYGTSALNGVINLATMEPGPEPKTEVQWIQGLYGRPAREEWKWWSGMRGWTSAAFSHSLQSGSEKQYGWLLAGLAEHDANYVYGAPDHKVRLLGKLNYVHPENSRWKYGLTLSGLWSETGDALLWNGFDQVYVPLDSNVTLTTGGDFFVDPKVTYRYGRSLHTLRGRFMAVNNNARSETTDYANYSRWAFGEYMWQFFAQDLVTTIGMSGGMGSSQSEIFSGFHRTLNPAVYAQADYHWRWLRLNAGLRYESMAIDDRIWSRPVFRIGANAGFRHTRFRASFGQGFRFPSMAEMFTVTSVGALRVFPNYDLKPESGWSAELGVRQEFKLGNWPGYVDVSAFQMVYEDMMEFTFGYWGNDPGAPFANLGFKSINAGKTRVRGIELTVAGQGKTGSVSWEYMGGFSWLNPVPLNPDTAYARTGSGMEVTYASTSSNPESGKLKYRYSKLMKWDMQAHWKSWSLGSSIRYNDYIANIDQIFIDPFFSQFIPGVAEAREAAPSGDWVLDARLRYSLNESVSIGLIVANMTNRIYMIRPALLGAPRSFSIQLRYKPQ